MRITESAPILKNPKWFYLVLRSGTGRGNDDVENVYKNLKSGKFKGLRGISDNPLITRAWFDVRDIMVVMSADEVKKLNDITQIEYFNPDQLVKNNFEVLNRILDNERMVSNSGKNYAAIQSTLIKIFQNTSYILRTGVSGKKRSRLAGTWDRDPSMKFLYNVIFCLNSSRFYYTADDDIVTYLNGGANINSVKDLANFVGYVIKTNRDKFTKSEYSFRKNELQDLVEHYDKYGTKYIEKILQWVLTTFGKTYNKREGEWVVNSDEFRIPKGSYLFFKKTPQWNDEDKEEYNKWVMDYKSYKDSSIETTGLSNDIINQKVSEYGLDKIYQIRTVKHSYEMRDILLQNFELK